VQIRKILIYLILGLTLAATVSYIVRELKESAPPPESAVPPSLPETPARVYGLVEPLGREVFLAAPLPRKITSVLVKEGDRVTAGQALLILEDDLEKRALEIAQRRIEEALAKIALTRDLLARNQDLLEKKFIAEYDYTKIRLQLAYEQKLLETARREAAFRQTDLDRLTLKSPIAGVVYKLDVRLGELLTPEDYRRIIIGKKEKQVRLFVEVFWRERYRLGQRVIIKDAETLQDIGVGNVAAILPYIGTRDFRTEESLERLDTKYNQVIVELRNSREVPIGLQVIGFSED
jgi:multidrug efflux pump subunit AcrA (membrane-fusion protein)